MIKVFTTNKNGKIELTKDELKNLLDEAYWDGYMAKSTVYTYQPEKWPPYQWTVTATNDYMVKTSGTIDGTMDGDCGVGVNAWAEGGIA